jgi:hypothetical protein
MPPGRQKVPRQGNREGIFKTWHPACRCYHQSAEADTITGQAIDVSAGYAL